MVDRKWIFFIYKFYLVGSLIFYDHSLHDFCVSIYENANILLLMITVHLNFTLKIMQIKMLMNMH